MIEVQNINGSSKERYATPPRGYDSWLDIGKVIVYFLYQLCVHVKTVLMKLKLEHML